MITKTIGFRLPSSIHKELEARGRREGLSPGQMAQRLVLESLADTRHEEVMAAIRLATMILLADAGKAESAEEAEALVRQRFTHGLN
jgi:hypothetical protein